MQRKDEVTNSLKNVPIPRSKERNAPFTSQFYAHVSRNASLMASDSTRPLLRRTYVARLRSQVSRGVRMVTCYVAKFQAPVYAEVGELGIHKGTGNSDV